ncbi:hypothetical protein [Persicitalea sp.]|uniref:hypothetical protein n=1 Tax=Persicitalea sp. TaxID=3100273 RepID=UPI0035943E10
MDNLKDSNKIDSATELDAKTGTITGVFHDKDDAEKAYNSLIDRGYTRDDISVLMSDETRTTNFKDVDEDDRSDLGNKAMEGAGVGSAIGGTAGAIVGAIAAIGTAIALPGLGLVIAGPIAAGLAGAGAGGLTGGIIGALVGSGIPEDRAAVYKESLENGGIVVGVKARNREEGMAITNDWKSYQGRNIHTGWESDMWSETRHDKY